MTTDSQQLRRDVSLQSPLGEDLLFRSLHATEALGRLASYDLQLLSPRADIDLDEILGQNVTLTLVLEDDRSRHVNGYVTRFSQGGRSGRFTCYSATVRPWLWFLARTSDCRIFQEMTVPQILEQVFADHAVAEVRTDLIGRYRTRSYCVQYRESDFDFISRLMEEEGIYYYIEHGKGHHTVVLVDATGKHAAAPGCETLPFVSLEQAVRPGLHRITGWSIDREIQAGVYAHDDYDPERPGVELRTRKSMVRRHQRGDYEIYDYPGRYLQREDGTHLAGIRIDELATRFETASATTHSPELTVGATFTLQAHPRADQNREYLVVSAEYDLTAASHEAAGQTVASEYQCRVRALSTAQQFRPARTTRKPFVQGPQTAVVVGASSDGVHTDAQGRVKVQFHWDRYGKKDENSSCWVRVSSPWAGKGWGVLHVPRIGQEVIVDFLEGDPDQPIVTGRVYNAEQLPPFDLPAGALVSGTRSRSAKGAGYNEISMDDTAGDERITIHAQHDLSTTVQHDETHTVATGRQTVSVKGDAALAVQSGHRSVTVESGDYKASAVGVNIGASTLATFHAPHAVVHGTDQCHVGSKAVTVNGTTMLDIVGPKINVGDGEIRISGTKITIAGPAGSVVLDDTGVTIEGSLVKIN